MGAGASIADALGKLKGEPNPEGSDSDGDEPAPGQPKKKGRHKMRGHGRDSDMGKARGKDPEATGGGGKVGGGRHGKKGHEKDGDAPVMDRRLYDWLPPPAEDIDGDRDAARTIFFNCDGEKWYIKIGWKTYDDPARWYGVTVEKIHHHPRVRGLELKGNELKGERTATNHPHCSTSQPLLHGSLYPCRQNPARARQPLETPAP